MKSDPGNKIVQLCAQGMMLEGEGRQEEAFRHFEQAWNESANNHERSIAAHYVARHQKTIEDKLKWDRIALEMALQSDHAGIKDAYPSFYLNIAKCYEDLKDFENAGNNYARALSCSSALPDDGYNTMIRKGILAGLERIGKQP